MVARITWGMPPAGTMSPGSGHCISTGTLAYALSKPASGTPLPDASSACGLIGCKGPTASFQATPNTLGMRWPVETRATGTGFGEAVPSLATMTDAVPSAQAGAETVMV